MSFRIKEKEVGKKIDSSSYYFFAGKKINKVLIKRIIAEIFKTQNGFKIVVFSVLFRENLIHFLLVCVFKRAVLILDH